MFDYTVTSAKSFEQAINDLKQALVEEKFGVLWELDVPAKLREKGVEFQGKFHILEVCNPHKAKAVLETNIKAGYFLPCKVVVYEEKGVTNIGLPKPSVLIDLLGDGGLGEPAGAVERELIAAIDRAR